MAYESPDTSRERLAEILRQSAEEARREHEALAALHALLLEFSAENLALHKRSVALLDALGKDLERIRARLKALATAR